VSQRKNYGFERRRRADALKAKQQAKRERRADRSASGAAGPDMGSAQDAGVQPGSWEWFSASRSNVFITAEGTRPPADPPDDWILLTETSKDTDPSEEGDHSARA
jgi:hypothetical protein